jgi:choline dehydrogenase
VGGGVVGYEAMTSHPGERRSAFVASLKPALGRPNLVVRTRARVRALRFEGDRAVAVTWDGPRGPEEARVDGEVLLCAGALESPAVLLRSGVGDGDRLRALGIDVVVDLPAVGEGLQDHPNVALFALGTRAIDADKTVLYAFDRVGDALPPGQPDCCLVPYPARASLAEAAARLAPGLVLPWSLYRRPWARGAFGGLVGGVFRTWPMRLALARTWGVVAILGKPRSRGSVRLVSADPRVAPAVDPAWLAEPEDVRVMLGAVERAQAWMASAALRPWAGVTLSPRAKGPALERWVRQGVRTTYHFAGTCRLGDVVRDDLRVRGLANVRVGDASILPDVPVAALDAPSRAIGWKAAGLMG